MGYQIKVGSATSPTFTFDYDNGDLISVNRVSNVDFVTEQLSIDQLEAHTFYVKYDCQSFAPKWYTYVKTSDDKMFCTSKTYGDLKLLKYGTPIYFYKDNILISKSYLQNILRVERDEWQLNCVSAIGLFDKQTFVGGMYSGETFETVVTEVIGGTVPFSCEEDVKSTTIYGWIPYGTKREALEQLMIATSATLTKDADGDIRFSYIYSTTAESIPDSRIYIEGDVDYGSPASEVQVTEHAFSQSSTVETLFDTGSDTATSKLVVFDSPHWGLATTGTLTIDTVSGEQQCGVNYAVVSGLGTLTGKLYTDNTNIITKSVVTTAEEKVITLSEAYLVHTLNSENVANRLMSYYSSRKVVKSSIVLDDEQCGRKISFNDAFGEASTGYIQKMDVTSSGIEKAECEIITDYTPQGQGNAYTGSALLTGSGSWTIPSSVLEKTNPTVKVILMGGGNGGQGGYKGSNGNGGSADTNGTGGAGGNGGSGGSGGKINVQVISVSGLTELTYSCGSGGTGGAINGGTGGSGGDTTLTYGSTTITSASGSASDNGYQDIFNPQNVYGRKGSDGTAGANGGNGGAKGTSLTYSGTTYAGGSKGSSISYGSYSASGGGGGGACVGGTGSNGSNAWSSPPDYYVGGGGGGNGASAIAQSATTVYAQGGIGGFGGGGGGGGGGATGSSVYVDYGGGGTGGNGGTGGQGGAGCLLILY